MMKGAIVFVAGIMAIFMMATFANARGIEQEERCLPNHEECYTGTECCSGFCKSVAVGAKFCMDYPSTTAYTCLPLLEECYASRECCSGFCKSVAVGAKLCFEYPTSKPQ